MTENDIDIDRYVFFQHLLISIRSQCRILG